MNKIDPSGGSWPLPFHRMALVASCIKSILVCTLTLCILGFGGPSLVHAQQYTMVLKNGMLIGPGSMGNMAGINESTTTQSQSGPKAKSVVLVDDGLRETFFNNSMLIGDPVAGAAKPMTIVLQNARRVSNNDKSVMGVNRTEVTQFDKFGRRICRVIRVNNPPLEILQGITEITPISLRVESLRTENAPSWDTRFSINSIDTDLLKRILLQNIDPAKEQDWLDVVSLLRQAKHYSDSIDVLKKAIKAMPQLEPQYRGNFTRLEQALADQMFEEVQIRRKAAQYQLSEAILKGFESSRMTDETKIKIQKRLSENQVEQTRFKKIIESVKEQWNAIADPATRKMCEPIIQEMEQHLNLNTIDRLVDFERLQADGKLKPEQRIALAIGGWILGPGIGVEELSVAKAAMEGRELVNQYLAFDGAKAGADSKRRELLNQLKKSEAGVCRYVAPMLSKLLPPKPLPEAQGIPGRFSLEVSIPQLGDEKTSYVVQLPPEYDPYRAYPCVLALPSASSSEVNELSWWVGEYNETYQRNMGEASRHGYVVVSPRWRRPDQYEYEYTENEHIRVLSCLRDAMRRVSIDSNRVFIAGHYSGGDAAWDIAQAHPDLWAGLVVIGAGDPGGFIEHYVPNGRYVPMYFVHGSIDGAPAPLVRCGKTLDKYIQSNKNDFMYVSYPGRGKDYFLEELPRIMEWMNLANHVRQPPPEEIEVRTTRPGDNFFWWLTIDGVNPEKANFPLLEFDFKRVAEVEVSYRKASNAFNLSKVPTRQVSLWLDPSLVDFEKKITVTSKGDKKSYTVEPDVEVLLEDARTRADRQRPHWARLEIR